MPGSGDIVAGRAGVQVYMDLDELKAGAAQAQQTLVQMNNRMSTALKGNIVSQAGIGLQDFVTVLSQGGTMATAIGAISNNLIQMASQIKPTYGGYVAIGIAAFQAAQAGYKMLTATKQNKEEMEKLRKEAEKLAEAKAKAARSAGEEEARIRGKAGDSDALEKEKEKAKADLQEKQGGANAARLHLQELQAIEMPVDAKQATQLKADIKKAEEELAKANEEVNKARSKVGFISGVQRQKSPAVAEAERKLSVAQQHEATVSGNIYSTMADQKRAKQAVEKAKDDLAEAKRTDGFDRSGTSKALAQAEKDSRDEQQASLDQEGERQAEADRIKKESMTPDEVAKKAIENVLQLQAEGHFGQDVADLALAKIERDRIKANEDYQEELNPGKKAADDKAKSEAESLRSRYMSKKEKRDQDLKEIEDSKYLTPDEKERYMARAMHADRSYAGTFSGAALQGLSASSPLDAIEKSSERTAKATEKMAKKKGFQFG